MVPSRYLKSTPAQVKKQVANLKHISAPLKGLSLSSKLIQGDPLTATVLDNWVIEENQIKARAGTLLRHTFAGGHPVETLVPYYGAPMQIAAAVNGTISLLSGTVVHSGFTGNDWSWTSFANLSSTDYTIMVNGFDGVWSWDGTAMVAETVTAPAAEPWITPAQFNIVLAHQNRLWFADTTNLAVYYLPLQQKSGEVALLPLNAIFKRGGTIRAMYTWSTTGATNITDQLVIFTTNGELAIYGGTDPTDPANFYLQGVYRFDAPMSKHAVANYGGELYCLISTGLVPMSTLMRAESEQLGAQDRNVFTNFYQPALLHRDSPGWSVIINPLSGRMICNIPQGGLNRYGQMVRFMPNPVWASWSAVPARCWGWLDGRLYFGSDDGLVYEMHPTFLNDNGKPIKVDVQMAWSNYGTPASKLFKMILPYIQTEGSPLPFIDMKVDYDLSAPTNQPDVTFSSQGAVWDLATWDVDGWGGALTGHNDWSGVGVIGRVGAPRLTALILNCSFAVGGWDVLYEQGSIFG
jgi:hypothetical protein